MGKVGELKLKMVEEIAAILKNHKIDSLYAVNIDEGSSPIIKGEESYYDENIYTLDRIYFEDDGSISVDSSSCDDCESGPLMDYGAEAIEGVLEWLKDNEEYLDEIDEDD